MVCEPTKRTPFSNALRCFQPNRKDVVTPIGKPICYRYWAVTNIDYIHQRTAKRIGVMILIIWSVAFFVSIAPVLGWKDPGWEARISENRTCLVSQDISYQVRIFAAFVNSRTTLRHLRVSFPVTFYFSGYSRPSSGNIMCRVRAML